MSVLPTSSLRLNGEVEELRAALGACLERPHRRARGMPAGFYTSPEFLAFEVECLFRKEWVCIGRVEEAAGARRLLDDGSAGRAVADRARRGRTAEGLCERMPPPRHARRERVRQRAAFPVPLPRMDLRPAGPAVARTAHRGGTRRLRSRTLPAARGCDGGVAGFSLRQSRRAGRAPRTAPRRACAALAQLPPGRHGARPRRDRGVEHELEVPDRELHGGLPPVHRTLRHPAPEHADPALQALPGRRGVSRLLLPVSGRFCPGAAATTPISRTRNAAAR